MTDITKMSEGQLSDALRDVALMSPIGDSWNNLARYIRTMIAAANKPVARVPVAMTDTEELLTVACNDGTIWTLSDADTHWTAILPIPQPAARKSALQPARFGLTPAQAEAQKREETEMHAEFEEQTARYGATTKPDALIDALLAAVMDCGYLLSGIVEREDDAGAGAYQPGREEHLRLLRMCENALDLARAEGII